MTFEWQQLLTHAVGFLITVWILKRFAWGPLLALLEERRNRIADEFKSIEDEKARVAGLTAEYHGKLKDIEAERRAKLVDAVNEGKKIAEEIRSAAREEAKAMSLKARADIERDVAKAKVQLKNDMVAMTVSATEKIIKEKLDDPKHRQLIGSFIDNVEKA
ncbi:MAG TPA: F0F1 ATP synthase subunit B [Candidatus Deferrimicrobium sp.]|nr:F0F1 ATP synthase subunit B [Candidatus Deferrimicrobium sp.]